MGFFGRSGAEFAMIFLLIRRSDGKPSIRAQAVPSKPTPTAYQSDEPAEAEDSNEEATNGSGFGKAG